MPTPDPHCRLLEVLQPSLAMYLGDTGIWTYPGAESLKLALADLVGDQRSLVERAVATLDERGVVSPRTAYPLGFTGCHDVDVRSLVPRIVAELRLQAAALDSIIESSGNDAVAVELAGEAKATSLRHLEILEQSLASAA